MEATLLYLLKANVVLVLFAAAYYGLLRRLTFFGLNRAYLLVALVFAAVYPALPVPALLSATALPVLPIAALAATSASIGNASQEAATSFFDWQLLGLGIYALGTGALLLRLLGQLVSLALVRRRTQRTVVLGQPVRRLAGEGGPFSFGQDIYLSNSTLLNTQHLPAALRHEQAHVRQHHTFDVLLAQVATALAWPNPAAWLLRRAVLDNLEYLADHAALQTGLDRRAYQYSLLHQQPGGVPAPALAFHFSFLTLKNRITMLNQPASTTSQLGRYLLAAPLVMALALGYSSAHAQVVPTPAPAEKPKPLTANATYYIDGQKADKDILAKINPKDISSINVLKGEKQQKIFGTSSTDGAVVVTTKDNVNSPAVLALAKRIEAVAPTVGLTPEQSAGMAAAQAYIAKNYPTAKMQMVGPAKQPGRFQTIFEQDGKRLQLFFDGQGNPVKE
jgi:hypothetical protein